jgi:hypothetical protein
MENRKSKQGRKNPGRIRLAVVISDIHAGSTVGLLPPGFVTKEGNEVRQNPLQAWLWDCWMRAHEFVYRTVGADPYIFILNGDAMEGMHHGTKQVISPEAADHLTCAFETVKDLAGPAERRFIVRGTECHVNNHEIALGAMLDADRDPASHATGDKQIHAFDRLTLDIAGTRCVWAHHIGPTLRSYTEATQLAVAITEEQIAAARNGEPLPRFIGRAHRHRFGYFENHHAMCAVSAPWQGLTRHGHKVVTHEKPHPGIYILDWRDKPDDSVPQIHHETYAAPHAKAIVI